MDKEEPSPDIPLVAKIEDQPKFNLADDEFEIEDGEKDFSQEIGDSPVIVAQLFQLQGTENASLSWNAICEGRVLLQVESEQCHLVIKSLIDQDNVFDTLILPEIDYKLKKEDSNEFVAWKDLNENQYTLSFATPVQCQQFYRMLQAYLKEGLIPMEIDLELQHASPIFTPVIESTSKCIEGKNPLDIPDCKLDNLDEIVNFFNSMLDSSPSSKYFISHKILQQDFVSQLFELFCICENNENEIGMQKVFSIVRNLCKLECNQIFEMFLHPQHIVTFAAIMEHCPKIASFSTKPTFVKHLYSGNKFQEFYQRENENLLSEDILRLIEHIFRLQYFREYVFPQVMEEDPIMNVSLLIRMCYKELFVMISRTPQFFNSINKLFDLDSCKDSTTPNKAEPTEIKKKGSAIVDGLHSNEINESNESNESNENNSRNELYNENNAEETASLYAYEKDSSLKIGLFHFFKDFFNSLKTNFIVSFDNVTKGINFDALFFLINNSLMAINEADNSLINLQLDVLLNIAEQEGQILREFVNNHHEENVAFLENLIYSMQHSTDEYIRFEICHCLRFILFSPTETDLEFFTSFYSSYINKLTEPITEHFNENKIEYDENENDVIYCILEVLEISYTYHFVSLKGFLCRSSFLDALVWMLTVVNDKRLLLAILRFLRSLLTAKDDYFTVFFAKRSFLKSIVFLLDTYGNVNDMLVSSVFSILEKIKTEAELKDVLVALIENHGESFREVYFSYNQIMQDLLIAYDKLFENPTLSDGSKDVVLNSPSNIINSSLKEQLEEDSYFANEDCTQIQDSAENTSPTAIIDGDDVNISLTEMPTIKSKVNEKDEDEFTTTTLLSTKKPKQMKITISPMPPEEERHPE